MGNRSLDDFLGGDGATGGDADDADDPTGDADDVTDDADHATDDDVTGDDAAETDVPDDDAAETDAPETGADDAGGTDGTADAGVAVATEAVEPAESTYLSRPGECTACGETVERRWQGEGGPVCPDCKEW